MGGADGQGASTFRPHGLVGFAARNRDNLKQTKGFEPSTSCLEGSQAISAAGASLSDANSQRGYHRICARQGVGLQPPVMLACPTVPTCLPDIKAMVRGTVLFRRSFSPAWPRTSYPGSTQSLRTLECVGVARECPKWEFESEGGITNYD